MSYSNIIYEMQPFSESFVFNFLYKRILMAHEIFCYVWLTFLNVYTL